MADPKKPVSKRTLANIFEEIGDRKLVFHGPDNLKMDSRYAVAEVAADHVVFKLLGDETLSLPYTSILSVKVERASISIRYR